jgi:hypothetical protein
LVGTGSLQGITSSATLSRVSVPYRHSRGVSTYVDFDNDRGDDKRAAKRRDALSALGVPEDVAGRFWG